MDRQTESATSTLARTNARLSHSSERITLSPQLNGESHQIIEQPTASETDPPHNKLIHELFEQQVERVPETIAVSYGEQALSYRELNRRANQLARCLRVHGVCADQLVALCVERCVEMLVGLLGILKAGGAYVPLDPTNPAERLEHVLADAQPAVLLTLQRFKDRLPTTRAHVMCLDADWSERARYADSNLDAEAVGIAPQNLAYVIYTSGSTGTPKGVMIEHRNVVNYAHYAAQCFEVESGSGSLVCTSFSFDLMLTGLYPILLSGKTVRLCSSAEGLTALPQELRRAPVGLLKLTPSHLALLDRALADHELAHRVKVLVVGGEALHASALQRWRDHAPNTRIFNHYGPTETTVGCVVHEIDAQDDGAIPIGRPIANTQVYILDQDIKPVAVGVAGDLYVGGAGVARGYWRRPELTAQRFIANPFSQDRHARLYKTGDLARWRSDGEIEYLGRDDFQVKIRGFRVELGEIEAQLLKTPGVREAVVLVREDVPGDKTLAAYLILQHSPSNNADTNIQTLRAHLRSVLPEYMIPAAFVVLTQFPLTPNGKLDRRALPTPGIEAYSSRRYEAPQGELEEQLAQVWMEVLGQARAGRDDNFFELGGHSLRVVQMLERLRQAGLFATLQDVYASQTLAQLAEKLQRDVPERLIVPPNQIPAECALITPDMLPLIELGTQAIEQIVRTVPGGSRNIQDIYPLTPLQEGILFHRLLNEDRGDTYILPTLLSLPTRAALDGFSGALQRVIDRHDILRSAVLWEGLPKPVQVVYRRATLPVQTLSLDPKREIQDQLDEAMTPGRQRFDLRQAPLLRLSVASDPHSEKWYAVLQTHHLIGDHVSSERIFAEVIGHLQGRADQLPVSVTYRDHVARTLNDARTQGAEAFFRDTFQGIDAPTAPFGLLSVHGDGSELTECRLPVDATLTERIRAQARRLKVGPATLFHAAWALVIAYTSGRDDVAFGTVLLGRSQGSVSAGQALGLFINTLPVRLRLHNRTARDLIDQTQRALVDLLNYEHVSLAVAQRCIELPASLPPFTTLLNCLHGGADLITPQASAESGIRVLKRREWTNYPLSLSVNDLGDGFELMAQTDRSLDPGQIINYLTTAVQSLVHALEANQPTPVLTLPVLPGEERLHLLNDFNGSALAYPRTVPVHQLFEEQARCAPDAPAVICEDESLSYAELNAAATRLARVLRANGVDANRRVAICMERSPDLLVGLLAILKAGAGYVPLDPDSPADRLQYLLEDCAPTVVLIQERLRSRIPRTDTHLLSLEGALETAARVDQHDLESRPSSLSAQHLAYVIYTSGSTGQPKGVMVEHQSLSNLVAWHVHAFGLVPGTRSSSMAGLAFDATTWELWPPLCSGGTLLLPPPQASSDPQQLLQWWQHQDVHVSFLVTPLAELAYATGMINPRVRTVLTGGDRLRKFPDSLPTGQQLVNNYGPTEATVVATSGILSAQDTVLHIGRPIANTRVYILNESLQPVPVGVTGELYIAGDGVARGYFNRPALTAERFLADPFCRDPRARMYRTGDLAQWRADGTINYLGRNDHQVKIRGYRIELGEIESQLSRHPSVQDTVVLAREDVPGEKRLAAYVVLRDPRAQEETATIAALREHLALKLPSHMVPSAVVILDRLPVNLSGKVDRRALPAPEAMAESLSHYEPPDGAVEQALADIWQAVLKVSRVSRHDNFFELGGHSLLALQLLLKINQRFECALTIGAVYSSSTLSTLAARIRGEATVDEFVDGAQEATLSDDIKASNGPPASPPQSVLITGATGFVGRFLLTELLKTTEAKLYCLVRARFAEDAWARLKLTLVNAELWSDQFAQRIVALPGNLSDPRLGLDAQTYERLQDEVDSIYHCGTSMNHLEAYAMARRVNVEATREIIKLATLGRPKLINHISSLGIFSRLDSDAARIVNERTPITYERHLTSQGYVASKWVADHLILAAQQRGIACNLFRLGLVWADTERGRYDELQREHRILQSCLRSGLGIEHYRYPLPPTPVDYTARAVVALAARYADGGGTFHISSPYQDLDGVFERCNEIGSVSLKLLPFYDWILKIKQLHTQGTSLPAVPLLQTYFTMNEAQFQDWERQLAARRIRFDCTRTQHELQELGVAPAVLDTALLATYLNRTVRGTSLLSSESGRKHNPHDATVGRAMPDKVQREEMLRRMLRIRIFDEEASRVKAASIRGFLHNSIGQEGEIVGACMTLREDDYMTGNHRSHGHPIGKGVKLSLLMAELFGKQTGVCQGKGGSMHLAAFSAGSLGESGIVGGSMPAAVGAGLSAQLRQTEQVCLCFFGDGAANCGPFHEALNLSAIWKLPVVFLCENNGYADCSPLAQMTAVEDIARRADAYAMPGVIVDGQDALAVFDAVSSAVERARAGQGPTLVEAKTYRYCEHMEESSSPTDYRTHEEMAAWRARDPIQILADRMKHTGQLTEEEFQAIEAQVRAEVADALTFAYESPPPAAAALLDDVFA